MPNRVTIGVYGRVQRVGYRDQVAEIARKLGIMGTVRNLEDEVSVKIIAEGDEESLKLFQEKINIQDPPIEVEKVDVKEEEPTGEFEHFKIQRGDPLEEIGGRMDVAAKYLYGMNKKKDRTIDILHNMNKKQDETINVLKDFSKETHSRFDTVDNKYGKISENLVEMNASLKELIEILKVFKPK